MTYYLRSIITVAVILGTGVWTIQQLSKLAPPWGSTPLSGMLVFALVAVVVEIVIVGALLWFFAPMYEYGEPEQNEDTPETEGD